MAEETTYDFVIVGGGPAGFSAARTLREEGATGSIALITRDPHAPYDRTTVTKSYLRGEDALADILLAPPDWWDEQRVDLRTRTSAMKLDAAAHVVTLSTKERLRYGKLLLATGSNVRRLRIDGDQLSGIHYVRVPGNADEIREEAEAIEHVVLVGGSYVATEVAASLTTLGKRCTLVMQEQVTLERTFGATAGGFFQRVLEQHGVAIHGGEQVARFEGDERVAAVVTDSGGRYEAELVVVGAGVTPDVHLAARAGLALGERGGVLTDRRLQTSAADVYAAGDVAEYDSVVHGRRLRVEHWDVAEQQGRSAALAMLGRDHDHAVVPYFFSDLADWSLLEYVGPAARWDEEVVNGSLDDGAFSVHYLDGGRLAAALSVGGFADLDRARELIAADTPVSAADL